MKSKYLKSAFFIIICILPNYLFAQSYTITGNANPCSGDSLNYQVIESKYITAPDYHWTIQNEQGTISSGQGFPQVWIKWNDNISPSAIQDVINVEITDNNGVYEAEPFSVSIYPSTYFDLNPTDCCVFENKGCSFSTHAIGGPEVTYQWEIETNKGWSEIEEDIPPFVFEQDSWLTEQLIISNVEEDQVDTKFRCIALSCDLDATSAEATLFIHPKPIVIPHFANACPGNTVKFTCSSEEVSEFLWKEYIGPGNYIPIVYPQISDTTHHELTIEGITEDFNNKKFVCRVTSSECPNVFEYTDPATVHVGNNPQLTGTISLSDIPICPNEEFDASITGISNAEYHWVIPEGIIVQSPADTNSNVLHLKATESGNYTISVSVSNNCGESEVVSKDFTVHELVTIERQSSFVNADPSGNATITMTVPDMEGITFQWWVKMSEEDPWTVIPNQNEAELKISGVTPNFNGYLYKCSATGNCNTAISEPVELRQINQPFTLTVSNHLICPGDMVTFNVESTMTGFNYLWLVGSTIVGGGSSLIQKPMEETEYTLVVTLDSNIVDSLKTTIKVYALPEIDLAIDDDTFCKNQKGVLLRNKADNGNLDYSWEISGDYSAKMTNTELNYYIIDVGEENTYVNLTVQDRTTTCNNSLDEKTIKPNVPNPDEGFVNWALKGDYILVHSLTHDSITWGVTHLDDFMEHQLPDKHTSAYYDFYPSKVNTINNLYWISLDPASNPDCPSKYYYVAMTPNETKSKLAGIVFPNPSFSDCNFIVPLTCQFPVTLEYYNLLGSKIKKHIVNEYSPGIIKDNISDLKNGLYIVRLTDRYGYNSEYKLFVEH